MIPPSPTPLKSNRPERPDMKYLPRYCPFLKKEVWAILTRQEDGSWRIVNCLDKDRDCFEENCAFTKDGGEWPFGDVSVDDSQLKEKP